MKRSLALVWVVLGGVATTFAAESSKTKYLVATRGPAAQLKIQSDREIPVRQFKSVNGFAAELTDAEVAQLRKSSEVLFIELDALRYATPIIPAEKSATMMAVSSAIRAAENSVQHIPYGLEMVGAPRVWNLGRGKNIKVAVIDTGIVADHPDIAGQYKGGYDIVRDDEIPNDEHGHGTHVAGTIAAIDNGFGVVGVAPDVELYALKVLDQGGSGTVSWIITAVDWAIENKMDILNLSLGYSGDPSILEEQAFARAADAGIIAVAASGNDFYGDDGIDYPANYSTVLSVGAVDPDRVITAFSQRGPGLKLVAPGTGVLSLSNVMGVEVRAGNAFFVASRAEGSPEGTLSGEFVFCGFGTPEEIPDSVRGRIALLERGSLTPELMPFRVKVQNAVAKGAIGAVIGNNVEGTFDWTLIRDVNGGLFPDAADFPWPLTVGVSKKSGDALKLLAAQAEMWISTSSPGYREMAGTSMATPHVAGVAALIWSMAPTANAQEVRQALFDSATDLGANGYDTVHGYGLVNAVGAARLIAPERFPPRPRVRDLVPE